MARAAAAKVQVLTFDAETYYALRSAHDAAQTTARNLEVVQALAQTASNQAHLLHNAAIEKLKALMDVHGLPDGAYELNDDTHQIRLARADGTTPGPM